VFVIPLFLPFNISPLGKKKNAAHAVVDGGKTIYCGRTYYFDTVEREWRRAGGGDWVLPFFGGAEYVPDLKLWLGFAGVIGDKY
jgi:hypothetical protein